VCSGDALLIWGQDSHHAKIVSSVRTGDVHVTFYRSCMSPFSPGPIGTRNGGSSESPCTFLSFLFFFLYLFSTLSFLSLFYFILSFFFNFYFIFVFLCSTIGWCVYLFLFFLIFLSIFFTHVFSSFLFSISIYLSFYFPTFLCFFSNYYI